MSRMLRTKSIHTCSPVPSGFCETNPIQGLKGVWQIAQFNHLVINFLNMKMKITLIPWSVTGKEISFKKKELHVKVIASANSPAWVSTVMKCPICNNCYLRMKGVLMKHLTVNCRKNHIVLSTFFSRFVET